MDLNIYCPPPLQHLCGFESAHENMRNCQITCTDMTISVENDIRLQLLSTVRILVSVLPLEYRLVGS